jgi:transposase-like protein
MAWKEDQIMKHRNWTAEEKMAIVLERIKTQSVGEVCRKYNIHQAQYYKWRDIFWEGAKKALQNGGKTDHEKHLEAKVEELEKLVGKQAMQMEILKKAKSWEK